MTSTKQWIQSLRIYSDLASIEPSVPDWKDRLKLVDPPRAPARPLHA